MARQEHYQALDCISKFQKVACTINLHVQCVKLLGSPYLATTCFSGFTSARKMSVGRRGYRPAGRREAFSVAHYDKFYLCHGIADLRQYNDDGTWIPQGEEGLPMQCFDFTAGTWKGIKPTTQEPGEIGLWHSLSALYAGVCSVVVDDCLYSFGGRRGGRERGCADVHELNLTTMVWRKVVPVNPEEGPMEKEKGGMVDYKGELLCVFGGYGMGTSPRQPGATYHWDPMFDRFWNNELHLFDLQKSKLQAALYLVYREG